MMTRTEAATLLATRLLAAGYRPRPAGCLTWNHPDGSRILHRDLDKVLSVLAEDLEPHHRSSVGTQALRNRLAYAACFLGH